MLKYFLALLGVCLAHAQDYEVKATYHKPTLTLSLYVTDAEITAVLFHYGIMGEPHTGRGVLNGNHYEYTGSISALQGDPIYAYADISYDTGLKVTTPHTTVIAKHSAREVALPFSRPVRGVLFRDDFDSYNQGNWHPEVSMFGGLNWEFEVYTPESKNIYAANGALYLRPTLTADDPRFGGNFLSTGVMDVAQIWGYCTNDGNYGCHREGQNGLLPPVMSGKVSSGPTLRFGTAEIRAKIPRGDWLWPAIWMMPKSSVYGGWPRSGEIDIMESRGNAGDIGVGNVATTLHWGPSWDQNRWSLTHAEAHAGDFSNDFHTFRFDWSPDYLRTYVDNNPILQLDVGAGFWNKGGFGGDNIWASGGKSAPFDQDFFIMFNVAVGGTNGYFPDNANWGVRKPWANNSPNAAGDFWNARNDWLPSWQGDNTALKIDYVEFRN